MVLVLAAPDVHFGQLHWIQGIVYGIGAAVIGIIVRKLVRTTVGTDCLLWVIFAALAVTTAWTELEIVWLFVPLLVKAPPRLTGRTSTMALFGGFGRLLTGVHGLASLGTLRLLSFFS